MAGRSGTRPAASAMRAAKFDVRIASRPIIGAAPGLLEWRLR